MVDVARIYVADIELLDEVGRLESNSSFKNYLDDRTECLRMRFPGGGKGNWGAARKSINLFLRDALYNRYLCQVFKLHRQEARLEIPLDKYTAQNIGALCMTTEFDIKLPRWVSIKSLQPEFNRHYQDAVQRIATSRNISRVHLDIEFWRNGAY